MSTSYERSQGFARDLVEYLHLTYYFADNFSYIPRESAPQAEACIDGYCRARHYSLFAAGRTTTDVFTAFIIDRDGFNAFRLVYVLGRYTIMEWPDDFDPFDDVDWEEL